MIDVRSMWRSSAVRRMRFPEARRRDLRRLNLEPLEGRALLSLTVQTHPIPETTGLSVNQIVDGPDGNLWFTESPYTFAPLNPQPPEGVIGRMTPAGVVTIFPLPTNSAPGAMTAGPDGNIWFVEFTGTKIVPPPMILPGQVYSISDSLVRITPNGAMTSFALPAGLQALRGPILLTGSDHNLWAVESGEVGKITPDGNVTVIDVGSAATDNIQSAVFGSDGNLWVGNVIYSNSTANTPEIDRITPTGAITRFTLPAQIGTPYDLVDGPDGNIWFLSNGVQTLISKISASGDVTTYPAPANLTIGSLATSTADNSLWFTAEAYPVIFSNNPIQIGRITTDGAITVNPAQSTSVTGNGPMIFGPGGNLWYLESTTITPTNSPVPQAIAEADFTPLTVGSATWASGKKQKASQVILTFKGLADEATANELNNYTLSVVRKTKHGLVKVRSVAIHSAAYNPTSGTVSLQLNRTLNPGLHYAVTVNGNGLNGLANTDGQHLSGAGKGHPGTDYLSLVRHVARPHAGKK
jgi:streptogramin lyase